MIVESRFVLEEELCESDSVLPALLRSGVKKSFCVLSCGMSDVLFMGLRPGGGRVKVLKQRDADLFFLDH